MSKLLQRETDAGKTESAIKTVMTGAEWDRFDTVDHMRKATVGEHDHFIALILGMASAWAYSDTSSLARMMHRRAGIKWNETVEITVSNPALLTDTRAYLVQSEDKKMCILCFRGTGPLNIINWMSNASAKPDLLLSAGHVHGGFLGGVVTLADIVKILLQSARKGGSICEAAAREKAIWSDCLNECPRCNGDARRPAGAEPAAPHGVPQPPREDAPDMLDALYITGHSLGGALAVVMAALLCVDPRFAYFREKLRGVYTYGQPMVGYQDFKDRFERDFGEMLFRHVYRNDVVPSLPARTMGPFVHFGTQYISEEGRGWVPSPVSTRVAASAVSAISIGALAWLQEQLVGLPILEKLKLRVSWADHAPINYLRTAVQAWGTSTAILQ
ncbi:lipase family protein [Sorangium sp. So ce204]|uniref:lipase family protein n=1 Tax=Sorangium sp. So ce204 TaxID=3133288 RepID=UPI003F62B57B